MSGFVFMSSLVMMRLQLLFFYLMMTYRRSASELKEKLFCKYCSTHHTLSVRFNGFVIFSFFFLAKSNWYIPYFVRTIGILLFPMEIVEYIQNKSFLFKVYVYLFNIKYAWKHFVVFHMISNDGESSSRSKDLCIPNLIRSAFPGCTKKRAI